jgi:16S rRNA (guanine527-N7)-methyltransferase
MKRTELSEIDVSTLLLPYGVRLDAQLYGKMTIYLSMLLQWNQRMALTTITDPSEVLRFHFGESLFASTAVGLEKGRLADVGSGAGFPGLALGMANPGLMVTLIESNFKKVVFLSEIIRKLDLENVRVVRSRMEGLSPGPESFDVVTSRAFGQFEKFLQWSRAVLVGRGRVALWVGRDDAGSISRGFGWDWMGALPIPNSEQRVILVGSPK